MLGSGLAHALLDLTAEPAVPQGVLERAITMAFDPAWNVEYRFVIFAAIMGLLFLSGVGLPFPEDIPLTLAGFTTIQQTGGQFVLAQYLLTFGLVVLPILGGDLVAYWLGRRFGLSIRDHIGVLHRVLTEERLARVQAWFARYGGFAVFIGRQVAGVRFVTFFTAGTMRMPKRKFLWFDFLGCVVSVPVWLALGTFASRYGERWLRMAMTRASHIVLLVVVLLAVGLAIATKVRNERRRAQRAQGKSL